MRFKKNHNSNNQLSPNSDITASKKIVFYILLFVLPLLFLFGLEIALRLFRYGGELDLFIQQTTGNRTEYVLNPNFTNRYFFQKGIKTPIPLSQTFPALKDSSTFRLFCLGASTTQGFPYPPNGGYPAILQHMLSDLLPHQKIEVINCGITAITSHSVLDMQREILKKYQPDLLIIYSGHNEFYGVFGQASTLSLFNNRDMVQLFLKLQRSRLFLLVRNAINRLFGKERQHNNANHENTLMRIMAQDVGIEFTSALFARTTEHYRHNIKAMCQLAQQHQTPLMLCTLVDNQRDLPPFASVHTLEFASRDTLKWHNCMSRAQTLQAADNFQEALSLYNQALEIDPTFAKTHFKLAQCYSALHQHEKAKTHFSLAKDYDAIRFRAPSIFNEIVKEASQNHRIPLADVQASFIKQSSGGVPGKNLLHEHVHPNLHGYSLIARTLAEQMDSANLVSDTWNWNAAKSDSAYIAQTRLTLLDHEIVSYTLFRLTSQWPFPAPTSEPIYKRIGTAKTEALAKLAVDENKSLVKMHLDYGHEQHQNGNLDAAAREYKAALAIHPLALTFNRLGRLYLRKTEELLKNQNDYTAANASYKNGLYYFKEGLERWPDDVEMNFNLGLLYSLRQDETTAAVQHFLKVLDKKPQHKNAHRQLVHLYIRQKKVETAKSALQQAINYFPTDAHFYTMLGILCLQEQELKESKKWFERAVQLGDHQNAKHYLQQVNLRLQRESAAQ